MNYVGSHNLILKYQSLQHQVAKISRLENLSLWQRLNSFCRNLEEKKTTVKRIRALNQISNDKMKVGYLMILMLMQNR